jgi:hypothetical protein
MTAAAETTRETVSATNRVGRVRLTRGNVGGSRQRGNKTPETGLAGWGTWIRTKIDGVRVRCSTVELSPTRSHPRYAGDRVNINSCTNRDGTVPSFSYMAVNRNIVRRVSEDQVDADPRSRRIWRLQRRQCDFTG